MFRRRLAIFLRVCLVGLAFFGIDTASASAQWTIDGADLAGRYGSWKDAPDDGYSPARAIGASSLAFGPGGTLFLALEKFPEILVFPADGSRPRRVRLQGVLGSNGQPDIDLEAMSICGGNLYLFDEDKLLIYVTPVDHPGRVTGLGLVFDGMTTIDNRATTGNFSDHSSVEGMVVTGTFLGPRGHASKLGAGPYFYLLDERDVVHGRKTAKLYIGVRNGDEIRVAKDVIAFDLPDDSGLHEGFRLPELFEYHGILYALMTRRPQNREQGAYKVVRCDLEAGRLREVCDFSELAAGYRIQGYDTNFEGAAVASDGRLFLTSDNESAPIGGRGPPPMRDRWRGTTPIVTLPVARPRG